MLQSCASETRSPVGASSRMFSMASLVSRYCGEVAHHQIVASLALQDLCRGVAAHGGLDGVLHIGNVDLVTRRLQPDRP